MAYLGRKGALAALNASDIPENLTHTGDYVTIPSATTAERDALTPVVGMLTYNTTLGIMQQYAASGWASIDSPPTVSSLNYPGDDTALDIVGEFNISCTTQTSTTVLVPGSTMPTVGQVVKGTGISAPVNNLTCGLTNTDATVTAASTTGLVVGMTVAEFTGVPVGATILSIITDTSFELSAVATATNASAVLSFNTTVESVSGTTSFVITPTATASATVTLTFNTQTLIITGTNFSIGATVTIDGTAPSTVTRNSSTQITVTGTPTKTTGTKVDGLVVTNTSGLSASINVDYSALPTWTTASGNLLDDFTGTITEITLVATGDAPITYAITTNQLPTGLSLVDNDINGNMTASAATYNFTITATDAEAQSSPRLFNIISKGVAPTGGNLINTYSYGGVTYRFHKFTASASAGFVLAESKTIDILVIGGGGGGGYGYGGGGGSGGIIYKAGFSAGAGTYHIVVGVGGNGGEQTVAEDGSDGLVSSFIQGSASTTISQVGGFGGGGGITDHPTGGAGRSGSSSTQTAGSNYLSHGGNGGLGGESSGAAGYRGGGSGYFNAAAASNVGTSPNSGGGGAGYDGPSTFITDAATTTAFLLGTLSGTDSSNAATTSSSSGTLYIAGSGGGARAFSQTGTAGQTGGKGGGGAGSGNMDTGSGGSPVSTNALANTGGGAGGQVYGNYDAGDGGSGVVIVRYAL